MSTIKVDAIQNTSGVEVYTAKAWVNFNQQGTQAIRADGNVSSITDGGVGITTVSYSSALSSANYALSGTATNNTARTGMIGPREGETFGTTAVWVHVQNDAGTFADSQLASLEMIL